MFDLVININCRHLRDVLTLISVTYVTFYTKLQPGGGTLNFSAYVGSDPASTLHPRKISGISSTQKYLKF